MYNNYWTTEDNQVIREYYSCYTAYTSGITRNIIFNRLQPKLNFLIGNAIQVRISSWSPEDKEEVRQDCLLKIWEVLNHKLDDRKIQGVLNFLWIVVNNQILTLARQRNRTSYPVILYDSELFYNGNNGSTDEPNNYESRTKSIETYKQKLQYHPIDDEVDINQIRQDIMIELDKKIIAQEKVNRSHTVYLILLKEFLIQNDYESKGFQNYICERMNITRKNFYQINFKLGMRCQVFNDK